MDNLIKSVRSYTGLKTLRGEREMWYIVVHTVILCKGWQISEVYLKGL